MGIPSYNFLRENTRAINGTRQFEEVSYEYEIEIPRRAATDFVNIFIDGLMKISEIKLDGSRYTRYDSSLGKLTIYLGDLKTGKHRLTFLAEVRVSTERMQSCIRIHPNPTIRTNKRGIFINLEVTNIERFNLFEFPIVFPIKPPLPKIRDVTIVENQERFDSHLIERRTYIPGGPQVWQSILWNADFTPSQSRTFQITILIGEEEVFREYA